MDVSVGAEDEQSAHDVVRDSEIPHVTFVVRPERSVYGRRFADSRTVVTHLRFRVVGALLTTALALTLAAACTIGSEDAVVDVAPTTVPVATVDEVVQLRTSTVRLGASPGRRPGQTPLEGLETIEVAAGRQLDFVRAYVAWDGEFPDQRHLAFADAGRAIHLSISPRRLDQSRVRWADIAEAKFGDPLFEEIQAWVGALAQFEGELFVTFHHEPEIEQGFGDADDYVAAWRRIAADLDARAPTIETIWVVTAGRLRDAGIDDWYPGDDVVDRIGMDVFNWYQCRADEPWKTAQESLSPLIAFGAKHPTKPLVIAEIGSVEDDSQPGRKAAWYAELGDLISTAAYERITMVSFFNNRDQAEAACEWWIDSTPASADAYSALANLEIFGGQDAAPAIARCAARLVSPGEVTDEALVDVDLDGIVDFATAGGDRFVGVGDQVGDGSNQRIILRFPPLATTADDGERIELRIRLGQQAIDAVSNVALGYITNSSTFGLDAYAAEVQPITDALFTPDDRGGYYTVDVTAVAGNALPSAFRLELTGEPQGGAYIIGMAEANNEADRPTLIVRTC